MKKICLLVGVLLLSGCLRAANYDIFSSRKSLFVALDGYKVRFYDEENKPRLMSSETVVDKNYKPNTAITVSKGFPMLARQIYEKKKYVAQFVKANKNGVLNSASLPVIIKSDKVYQYVGEVVVDGETYQLLPCELADFYFMVKEDGTIYNRIGQIKDGYLVLVESEFFPYPADLKMVAVQSSNEQKQPLSGYDVRYEGINLDRIWFTYLEYDGDNADAGVYQKFSFPNKPGLIELADVGLRVLHADDEKITFMVLQDNN